MDFDHSVSCSTTLNDEVSATGFPLGALGVAGRFGVGRSQWQKNARFLPEPRLLLIFSPHLLQILSTGMSGFIFYIPRLYGQKPLFIRSAIRTQLSQQHKLLSNTRSRGSNGWLIPKGRTRCIAFVEKSSSSSKEP